MFVKLNSFIFFIILCIVNIHSVYGAYSYGSLSKISTDDVYNSSYWKNLIHYENDNSVINADSDFFLSSNGSKKPKDEYDATLKAILNPANENNSHVICRYPARFNYIINALNLKKSDFPNPKCTDYQEYRKKVPFENISIVFAAENNQSPSSMLGHTFLKISGQIEGVPKQHAFSYFAALDNSNSLRFYADVITTGLDGAYILSPYRSKADEYLLGENRSLWEFELKLSPQEKELLVQHLWELKGKNIRYKFVTHNCNTALMSILKVANEDFDMKTKKPFITPVEYIQDLQKRNKISSVSIEPSISQKNAIQKFELNYIGNAPKATRFSIRQDIFNHITNIELSPVYHDIRDVSTAYFPELESKILDLSFSHYNNKNKYVIDKIELLKMMSIIDYQTSDSYSKYFRIGFENDLFSEKRKLNPVVELGLGVGKKISSTTFYILPKAGYHYDKFSSYYIAPQLGGIVRIKDAIRIIGSYEQYFYNKNNIGYKEKYNLYLGYKMTESSEFYIDSACYTEAKHSKSLSMGITFHF